MLILLTCERSCVSMLIIVYGGDFISGGPRHQLQWLEEVMDKHFESKPAVLGASSDLAKSLVMLNRTILWQDNGIAYIPDNRHCERVVEALNLQHAVVMPAVRERAKVLMVRANAHVAKVKRHRRMMYWTQTRRVCTEAQWPG